MTEKKACFADTRGREWPLFINVFKAREVKNKVGIDLLNFFTDEKSTDAVNDDPFRLLEVFYLLSEAAGKNVTEQDFFEAFDGNTVEAAQAALMEALVNFSPTRQATVLRALIDKTNAHREKSLELIEEKIKTLNFGS